ncbi:MAG: LuxR family transcriptional regulator [Actinomycetales bacterium]|jgi:quercetin dioxygenase-like cupin family protein|nr:LuxR family transcriptional regulator [Actinomycetales bacterium]
MDKLSLVALARNELEAARRSSAGRSAKTVHGGHEKVLRQTLVALCAGRATDQWENPGEATVHVVTGRVAVATDRATWEGSPGDLIVVPRERTAIRALEDSVVLLTVAKLP